MRSGPARFEPSSSSQRRDGMSAELAADFDTDAFAAELLRRARFLDAQLDGPRLRELPMQHRDASLAQGFQQAVGTLGHERLQRIDHRAVINGAGDVVRRNARTAGQRHRKHQRLPDVTFPVVNADDRFDGETFDEYPIHAQATSGRLSRFPRGSTWISGPVVCPAASRIEPASAIIAPLSVQNASRGK